jgi:selenide,water dikinase
MCVCVALRNQQAMVDHPRYALLFVSQTAGGLLASVPRDSAEACLTALRERGYPHATFTGRVCEQSEALVSILLKG